MRAPAKVNLALEILGRRPDGYHELATVVHAVALYDELLLEPANTVSVKVEGAVLDAGRELVGRAARLLRERLRVEAGARIVCRKRIPLAAGLGGGSSDAAATLRGLARLWGQRLSPDILASLAAELGSDVPLFLLRGAALVCGRGERVAPLPAARGAWAVLVPRSADFADKTARLFAAVSPARYSDGARAEAVADALRRGELPQGELPFNAFEPLAGALYPGLADLQVALSRRTGVRFLLSGAGPSLFALCANRAEAVEVLRTARPVAPGALGARLVGAAQPLRRQRGTDLA